MEKFLYEAPVVETICFRTEAVLSTSITPGGAPVLPDDDFDD